MSHLRALLPAALVSGLLLISGLLERVAVSPDRIDPRHPGWQVFLLQRELFLLVGAAGLVLVALVALAGRRREELVRRGRLMIPALIMSGLLFLGIGELAVRVLFWGGIPFSGGGPIARDFEDEFVMNRFEFEGRSRGPDYSTGSELPDGPRLLVQGDSITWGAGIRQEKELYTHRLLDHLREQYPGTELAVLAYSGREIDGHLGALERFGAELQPDVIVYQWYVNDLEVDPALRPQRHRLWRRSDIHQVLVRHSYFWFFMDNRLDGLLPGPPVSYTDYILQTFGEDTAAWEGFRHNFVRWAERARSLTPNVVVLLYPATNTTQGFWPGPVHARVSELAERQGLTVIDFIERCDEWREDYSLMFASPYDRHPNEAVHGRMAEVLRDVIWPMLGPPTAATPALQDAHLDDTRP